MLAAAGFLPSADCAPADWARRGVLISRGSRFHASAANFCPSASPSNGSSDPGGSLANCPMVRTPFSDNRALVTGPTPHINSTGRSWRKSTSVAGSTTTSPSGLATCEAIFARCLVRATPTEIGSPSSSRTRRRIALAISAGGPKRWVQPATSAKPRRSRSARRAACNHPAPGWRRRPAAGTP